MNFKIFQNVNWFLYFCVFSAELLGLSFGMALGWTSPTIPILYTTGGDNPFHVPITRAQEAWITGLLSLGACIGPRFAGILIHRFGRKKIMVLSALLVTVSFLVTAFAPSIVYCLCARFVLGLGCAFLLTALPMYIGEIVDTANRGAFGCLFGLTVATGVAATYVVGGVTNFRTFSVVCAIPSILCLITFGPYATESPYYYASHGDRQATLESLDKLREDAISIDKTLLEINKYIQESDANKGGFRELINSKCGKRSLIICGGSVIFQQICGVTVVTSYMQSILEVNKSGIPANTSSVFISVLNIVVTIATCQMADRFGRKILFIISSAGCMVFLAVLAMYFWIQNNHSDTETIYWLPVVCLTGYMASVALGLGPLPFALTAEMFPSNLKSLCTAITVKIYLISSFVATFSYPFMQSAIGVTGTFFVYAAFSGLGTLFFVFVLPETKGKTFEEIQAILDNA